jgi:hypothetical protein
MCSFTLSLNLSLDGQGHASIALLLGKRPVTQVAGAWVGLRAGRDCCVKSHPRRHSVLGLSSI